MNLVLSQKIQFLQLIKWRSKCQYNSINPDSVPQTQIVYLPLTLSMNQDSCIGDENLKVDWSDDSQSGQSILQSIY
jgi:hypothetical protein